MKKLHRVCLAALIGAVLPACGAGGGGDDPVVAFPELAVITLSGGNVLTTYSARAPGVALDTLTITGHTGNLVGIDFRPATGQLYAVSDDEKLWIISPTNGNAQQVGVTAFNVALSGTLFGVDFSPTLDRLRIGSDADQNMRIHPTVGQVENLLPDGNWVYASGDANFSFNPGIAGLAYSNNFSGAAATTLFAIDVNQDCLAYSPNTALGTLLTVGSLGVLPTDASFDITSANQAYAALAVGGVTNLYGINLLTGTATLVGQLGTGAAVQGMTLAVLPAFAPASGSLVALRGGTVLVNHPVLDPTLTLGVLTISGHTGNLVGIEYRPSTGALLAVSDADRLYSINLLNGTATQVGINTPFSVTLAGTTYGVAHDPVADVLRLVTEADENQRVSPVTGDTVDGDAVTVGVQPDTVLTPGTPNVVAIAYTAAGVFYGIDTVADQLFTSADPSLGVLTNVGAWLGLDATAASFDIAPNGTAYAALHVGGTTRLYTVDLGNGMATLVSVLGIGQPVDGLTVKP